MLLVGRSWPTFLVFSPHFIWLDDHAPNWTIILMQNADNESWQDSRSHSYVGMDAVENATGRGLSNKTAFLSLTDSNTNSSNGAIFLLFLEEVAASSTLWPLPSLPSRRNSPEN